MAAGRKTGSGSRKGRPNKISADVKAAILAAFDKVGGEAYLARQAEENPIAFMSLLAKVLPLQVSGTGNEGEIVIQIVKYGGAGVNGEKPHPSLRERWQRRRGPAGAPVQDKI